MFINVRMYIIVQYHVYATHSHTQQLIIIEKLEDEQTEGFYQQKLNQELQKSEKKLGHRKGMALNKQAILTSANETICGIHNVKTKTGLMMNVVI